MQHSRSRLRGSIDIRPFQRFAARLPEHELVLTLKDAGIDLSSDSVPERLSHDVVAELLTRVEEVNGDESLGLRFAQKAEPTDLDLLHYIARASPTLRSALIKCRAHITLLHDGLDLVISEDLNDRTKIEFELPIELPIPRAMAELAIGFVLKLGRHLSGKQINPLEVHFRHPRPNDTTLHHQFFKAQCFFASEYNGMIARSSDLELAIPSADERLCELLEEHANRLSSNLDREELFKDRVKRYVVRELSGGNPNIEHVAHRLGLSERTVRRRLEEEDTTYQSLLGELRVTLAQGYLKDQIGVEETAFLLGYSSASAFRRAFKRLTGQTPTAYSDAL